MAKDLSELYDEYEKELQYPEEDVYRTFDEVEADTFNFYFRRGSDGHIVDFTVKLPYDATYHKVSEYFAQFISEVYEYGIEIEAQGSLKKQQKQQQNNLCKGCTNTSCMVQKGC